MMKNKKKYAYSGGVVILFLLVFLLLKSNTVNPNFTKTVKVALREVGHQLLLQNKDTTSLVLPITVEKGVFQLSFQQKLAIEPSQLTSIVSKSFKKAALPKKYTVEVLDCIKQDIVYSYIKKKSEKNSIIPCKGRALAKKCYFIQVKFKDVPNTMSNNKIPYLVVLFIVLGVLIKGVLQENNKTISTDISVSKTLKYSTIGNFKFYPEQHKLIQKSIEIKLSKKECEILSILTASPNEIVKREELTKKVWEDNGVIVGRSLDTYISKLRKKLQADERIKITNVHGVGYKLEI